MSPPLGAARPLRSRPRRQHGDWTMMGTLLAFCVLLAVALVGTPLLGARITTVAAVIAVIAAYVLCYLVCLPAGLHAATDGNGRKRQQDGDRG